MTKNLSANRVAPHSTPPPGPLPASGEGEQKRWFGAFRPSPVDGGLRYEQLSLRIDAKRLVLTLIVLSLLALGAPASADEQFTYISQPETMTVFLNGVAFVRDTLTLASDTSAQIVLPNEIYQDTLVLWENGVRVPTYTISRATGQIILTLAPSDSAEMREITLEYLTAGIGWTPFYDMRITEGADTVSMAFFASIQNASSFALDGVDTTLAAGRVDIGQQVDQFAAPSANQYIAGYEAAPSPAPSLPAGAVTIQHTYPLGALDAAPGDMLYQSLLDKVFPARRVLLWNAPTDPQVTVIYKVRNDSDIPLAEGIVRSYQDDLFIGSDPMEFTPVGGEGSVTVGRLQDVRVNRAETTSYIQTVFSDVDTLHEITLTMNNFGDDAIEVEVVDGWPTEAIDFTFSQEPVRDAGNLFRWTVTLPPGEEVTIKWSYKASY